MQQGDRTTLAFMNEARKQYEATIAKAGLRIKSFEGQVLTLTYKMGEDVVFAGQSGGFADYSQNIRFAAMQLPPNEFPGIRSISISL
jgi:hypothetical protein